MFDGGRTSGPPAPDAAFEDVIGQAELKRALVTVGAHDDLSGLLVRGEKGTGKSSLARALAGALPERRVVADCPFGCPPGERDRQCPDCKRRASVAVTTHPAPFVTLPLGATREAVVGSLSVADALDGEASFEPGLLARANRGVLYVDEVNLLDDHLVDVLLDAAAAGVNRVERDGVSRAHPAEFTLIGTMNPEEGDLRPQLRDRFDLAVEVAGLGDTDNRVAVVERALGGLDDGGSTVDDRQPTDPAVVDPEAAVDDVRDLLPAVTLPEPFVRDVVETCRDAGVDGHRGDIAAARCARALAALDGRTRVAEGDVRTALSWALPHRLRSDPFDDPPDAEELIDDRLGDGDDTDPDADGSEDATDAEDAEGDDGEPNGRDGGDRDRPPEGTDSETDVPGPSDGDPRDDSAGSDGASGPESESAGTSADGPAGDGDDASTAPSDGDAGGADGTGADSDTADGDGDGGTDSEAGDEATPIVPGSARAGVGDAAAPEVEAPDTAPGSGSGGGRGDAAPDPDGRGARVRTERADPAAGDPVDAGASVRAAAQRGSDRVESRDLRRSVRSGDAETLVCFVVDASASMRGPMRAAKGVAVELLRDSYEHRDAVALIAVAGDSPDVLLPPTDDIGRAARHLKDLPAGDRTPLAAGLDTAAEVCARADPEAALAVVVTDGGANAADRPTAAVRKAAGRLREAVDRTLVVDAGERDGVVPTLVEAAGGDRVPLSALSADRVDRAADEAGRG